MAELLSRVSSGELTDWMAFYQVEPWGEERADLRAGIVAAAIANTKRRKGQKPFAPKDFMPRFGPKEAQTVEEQLAIVEALNLALGGTDKRKKRGAP